MWGAELGSQVSLDYDLYVRGSLSYVEARNESAGRPLSEIPPLRGTVSLRYDNGTFFFEALENLAREQDRVDSGLNETTTAGWVTTDIKSGINYQGFSGNFWVSAIYSTSSISATFPTPGTLFQSGIKVPENGRNVYLSLGYKF